MRKVINFGNHLPRYESIINFNKQRGYKSYIFASKIIPIDVARTYHSEYMSAKKSSLDQDSKLQALARQLEIDLELESVVGFKNSIMEDGKATIRTLKQMGIRVHLLSGDSMEHCLMTSQSLGLMSEKKDIEYMTLNFMTADVGKSQIKKVLDEISKTVSQMNLLASSSMAESLRNTLKEGSCDTNARYRCLDLLVSGETVEVIRQDQYLLEHFLFILEFTKTIIGHDFTGWQKKSLVAMYNRLNKQTMAVGDGYNDLQMAQEAKIGIQVSENHVGRLFGDIVVNNLLVIPMVINLHCRDWNNNLVLASTRIFMYGVVIMMVNLLYQIFCNFSAVPIIRSYLHCIGMLFTIPPCLYIVFFTSYLPKATRAWLPGIYCEKNFLNKITDIRVIFHQVVDFSSNTDSRVRRSVSHDRLRVAVPLGGQHSIERSNGSSSCPRHHFPYTVSMLRRIRAHPHSLPTPKTSFDLLLDKLSCACDHHLDADVFRDH